MALGQKQRTWLGEASVLLRRELMDTLRDWRIIVPIVLLTLFFPFLMNLTAGLAVRLGRPGMAARPSSASASFRSC